MDTTAIPNCPICDLYPAITKDGLCQSCTDYQKHMGEQRGGRPASLMHVPPMSKQEAEQWTKAAAR